MLNKAIPHCPFWIKEIFSLVKVENVVKPPQKPVTKRRRSALEDNCNRAKYPERTPIKRHPKTLTKTVAKGKP